MTKRPVGARVGVVDSDWRSDDRRQGGRSRGAGDRRLRRARARPAGRLRAAALAEGADAGPPRRQAADRGSSLRGAELTLVQVPLIVEAGSGVNDNLDRDGSRTPVSFHISNDRDAHPVDAEVVQAATKWKRMALAEFGMGPGEGLLTDMRAVRKDYFLDH